MSQNDALRLEVAEFTDRDHWYWRLPRRAAGGDEALREVVAMAMETLKELSEEGGS